MCKQPDESKFTTILPQCLQTSGVNADLSALYNPSDLAIENAEYKNNSYHMYARCNLAYVKCPHCGHANRRVRRRYIRTISELSILGKPVVMTVELRKFLCDDPGGRKKTFAELPCFAASVRRSDEKPFFAESSRLYGK